MLSTSYNAQRSPLQQRATLTEVSPTSGAPRQGTRLPAPPPVRTPLPTAAVLDWTPRSEVNALSDPRQSMSRRRASTSRTHNCGVPYDSYMCQLSCSSTLRYAARANDTPDF